MTVPTQQPTRPENEPGTEVTSAAPAESREVDIHDPRLTRFDLVREGARRDGVEIMLYEPRFEPGSRAERRVVRVIAMLFLLAGAAATAFMVAYIAWPWQYEAGADALSKFYTPVLGVTLAIALFCVGAGIVAWTKKLLPHEVSIEQRHDGPSESDDQTLMGATLGGALEESGLTRRPLLKGALALGLAPFAVVAAAPIVGGLIRDPHDSPHGLPLSPQDYTGFTPLLNNDQPVRLVREDGTPIRPADVSVAGQLTVFPGVPGGATNEFADSPTLLIHLREEDAELLRDNLYEMNDGSMVGNFVAYSKICTHAGCPPSLFEQQTNLLLCPCHQSQFLITDNARPVFGPAARSLPMLPLALDAEGYFVAASDYKVPVGPSFWEL
ncbi:Rieske (2Fe-2S) protein [Natronosporangium hydrolyticum]|uniref:Cytochrome bc1 complex Rieske iron-sulfur subunit n=1 Tax=Natronosporangium hydrolyticum TaxID=2811111 RepID=A0A895YQ05_9ACTN|nr:Rieske 2Fe-2S domain-containing protein [Natronosporangium hydrolyticum]QSB16200.1 Rieske (2Fe-2S) protein [Natronosporangium hydrolyticum]